MRYTDFMVVEITPVGIDSLHWKFYIIWTVFNAAFVPIVYFFYPETAARSLEDLDRYFAQNKNILVFRDKVATSSKRPEDRIEHERTEYRRHSSVRSVEVSEAAKRHLSSTLAKMESVDSNSNGEKPPVRLEKEEV